MPSPMTKFALSTTRRANDLMLPLFGHEEELIVDHRAAVRPAQMVENKLNQMLPETFHGISHLRLLNVISKQRASA